MLGRKQREGSNIQLEGREMKQGNDRVYSSESLSQNKHPGGYATWDTSGSEYVRECRGSKDV